MTTQKVKLQERDIQILRYLKDFPCMNLSQIKLKFWPKSTPRAASQRMQQLCKGGLVENVNNDFLRNSSVYFLTKDGLKILEGQGYTYEVSESFLNKPTDIVTSGFQHDMRLVDIRLCLETDKRIKIKEWITETHIWADKERFGIVKNDKDTRFKVPDALFEMEDGEGTIKILLEYEHQAYQRLKFTKYIKMWEEYWSKYQKLIVCAHKERVSSLVEWCKEDLVKYHKVDIGRKIVKLEDLAANYMFTDFKTLLKTGITGSKLISPLGFIEFSAIS